METNNAEVKTLIRRTFIEAIDNLDKNYAGSSLTDIFITVDKELGELVIFDDEENRVAEIVIFDWVEKGERLNDKEIISELKSVVTELNKENAFALLDVYKPFSVNYADDNFDVIEEILLLNDDSTVELDMDNNLMEKFDREFDEFLERLLKD